MCAGDSCCNPLSLGGFTKRLAEYLPGVYVHSLRIGNNAVEVSKR
jgi:palmitoyl-protein thioesterase